MYSQIITTIGKSKNALLIMLDLSSAFDTVDHEILIEECKKLGFRDRALGFIASYLSNRSVKVACGDKFSQTHTLEFGVPQGSILGPTLFQYIH